jgi:IS30 family transposase
MMMLAETCIIGGTMDGYSHLSIAEREDIMIRWKGHEGVSQIARELGRDKSTISREIRRNGWQGPSGQRYRASTAQRRADARRLRCRRPRLMDDPERRALVVELMRDEHWSPEEISGRIAMEHPSLAVSDDSIYRAVESGSLDCGLPGHRKASRLLRHHGKRRHVKGSQERRGKFPITHDISERPEEASSRSRIGDWEGDTVAGSQGGACLVTQVDRMSGFLAGGKAARKAHAEVNEATEKALAGRAVHTVTLDRGKEFSDAKGLQEALGAPVYFCHPHHPWERGTNENTNGLLRDWFPKGMSLDDVTDDEVQRVYDSLNRRPRKRLGWKCPWEVYHHQSLHLL